MQTYQCPPGSSIPGFETGVVRLEFVGEDAFNLAYLRHNGKWWTLVEGVSLEECLRAVGNARGFRFLKGSINRTKGAGVFF